MYHNELIVHYVASHVQSQAMGSDSIDNCPVIVEIIGGHAGPPQFPLRIF